MIKEVLNLVSQLNVKNLRKYFYHLRTYGLRITIKTILMKAKGANFLPTLEIKPLLVPNIDLISCEESLPFIDRKVSVVIPTKNAGKYFKYLLRKLRSQKGIKECEIIIVDSGSSNDTLSIARSECVKIVEIAPEKFSHSLSRNIGAEVASGEFLLFMVQDALPLSNQWLWEMAKVLEENDIVAISCAEYPSSEQDLFYGMLSWNHYKTLNLDKDRILSWDKSCSFPMGIRSNSQINNISSLIKREIFEKYKFQKNYGEDLDLGMRLIRDGYRLGFLYTTRVMHSHHRSPYYFLKRAYVDKIFLAEIFPSFGYSEFIDYKKFIQDVVSLLCDINKLTVYIHELKLPMNIHTLFGKMRTVLECADGSWGLFEEDYVKDRELFRFMKSLIDIGKIKSPIAPLKGNKILLYFLDQLKVLEDYASRIYDKVSECVLEEIVDSYYKIFALQCGWQLANLYLSDLGNFSQCEYREEMNKILTEGI